jgi:acyl-coenzyme A thioesterase PaaI-like protein
MTRTPISELDASREWSRKPDAVFERLVGTLWVVHKNAATVYGLKTDEHHDNGSGSVHGGILAIFADHAQGLSLRSGAQWDRQATIHLDLNYISAVRPGEFIEAHTETLRITNSLAFVRAKILVGLKVVATSEGIRKLERRSGRSIDKTNTFS